MTNEERILEIIRENADGRPGEEIKLDATWREMRVDSLEVVSIIMHVEESFGIDIDDAMIDAIEKPRDLLILVDSMPA